MQSPTAANRHSFMTLVVMAICAPLGLAQMPATEPASDANPARDPLATKQQIVRDRMTQLEDRMFRLTDKLSKTEPDQARKLEAAMKRAQQLLIRRNMDDAIRSLEEGNLTDAAERQAAVTKGLDDVLKILLEEGDNSKERQAQMDRIQAYRDQVQRLLENERKLKTQADAAPRLARMLAGIRAAIARLESLIDKQQKEIEETSAAAKSGNQASAGKLGESQKSIREDTQDVGKMLETPAGQPAPAGAKDGASPAENPSSPKAPPGGEKSPSQPAPGQDGNQGSDQNKNPSPGNPAGKNGAAQGEAGIEAGVRDAREDVDRAAGQMQAAENELGRQALQDASPMQKKALESLRRAMQQLKQQEQETRKQLDQAEAAKRQRDLQQKAQKLAEQMKSGQSPQDGGKSGQQQGGQQKGGQKGGQQQGGQQQGGQQQGGQQQGGQQQGQQQGDQQNQNGQKSDRPQQPTPGNENVEQAGQHMQKAADELDKNKPEQAGPEQQKSIEQLEQAQRELEQALDQLRREQQEEILRGLESRFRAMLAQQLIINEGTLALDKKGRDTWAHADELKLAGLAQDQSSVADQAGQALNILKEEGTTVVFPRIVEQMREDMNQVAKLLNGKKTDVRTQRIQSDIATTLKDLVDAIKEMRKKLQEGEGNPSSGGQSQTPPLLPSSAELKLLRSCQQRVNRQTSDFYEDHTAPAALDAEAHGQLDQIARRQEEVAEMARKMNERITGQ